MGKKVHEYLNAKLPTLKMVKSKSEIDNLTIYDLLFHLN